ncbi:precorrin isomerase [Chamaesiphon minutus PCC 6605]|uniref:Precorrin isomerase n=1 Tax=Chamaesiphon minutus (strain ATCC 27169 / PCC 6605) TaxID=1173020 RepID=K9UDE3_CHAP6|nr:precorrin isomerase [Chamaesiphon minutus PCC 6605]
MGLLPPAQRSIGNYRLYTPQNVQQLQRIVALKQQGFQLSHIQQILESDSAIDLSPSLVAQLQQQYQSVIQQLARLRHTASALEGILGRDSNCQIVRAEAIAQLKLLEVESQARLGEIEGLWHHLDGAVDSHPEAFQESLQHLLPDLSARSEIEVDLLSQLVLACGDVSLVNFVRLSGEAIGSARAALKSGCRIMCDVPAVTATLDRTRLAHLDCQIETLIDDPHITGVAEAEQAFWQDKEWLNRLHHIPDRSILIIGYAPSVLMAVCNAIEQGQIQPALVIGMPIGFSHAPAAKRRLMAVGMPYITIQGSIGGGLLAAVAANALIASLLEKPDCHCHLKSS